MTIAMNEPMNHVQTAVAGPPKLIGTPYVAGCDPSTPRMEIAYETVDHLVNSRRNSCLRSARKGRARKRKTDLFVSDAREESLVVVLYRGHDGPLMGRSPSLLALRCE